MTATTERWLGSSLERARTFVQNTIAQSPQFGSEFTVVNIGTEPQDRDMLWLHLSNGAQIILHLEVEGWPEPHQVSGSMSLPEAEALVVADIRQSYPEMNDDQAIDYAIATVDSAGLDENGSITTEAYKMVLNASSK